MPTCLQPHRTEGFKFSTGPLPEAKAVRGAEHRHRPGDRRLLPPQAIRRGSYTSVRQLTQAIGAFIDHWNEHPRPFAWTKDADQILASINRAKTKANVLTDH
jgi:hypothetical protein